MQHGSYDVSMSAGGREPICSELREKIATLATPDLPEIDSHKQFYPRDKLSTLLSRTQVAKVLACKCARCQTDQDRLRLVGDSAHTLDSIVGRSGSHLHPAETAISLLGLLLYIGHPQFIAAFLQKRCNDHGFESHHGYSVQELQEIFGANYCKRNPQESSTIAKSFRRNMFGFAIPRMDNSSYTVYDERTVLPFINEEPIGRLGEGGIIIQEGYYGQVFSFEIYEEYRNFPVRNTFPTA